ncbi:hypothetical protein LX36DRAFT_714201 [Colletotrichum falcatum]|nr:hypothetical protein LX36DRAFT_714201 [Colletotrichum falcatum]
MIDLFYSPSKAPQRVPTDHVVPVGYFDDTTLYRTFLIYTMFVFDDALDAPKLRSALERVITRPGWNKLGARIRRNGRGGLEHHIPATFTPDRPAIAYEHVDFSDTAMEDHPSGSRIPRPPSDGRPAIVGDPDDLHHLVHGPNTPKGLNDYLYHDRPELGLRIVSFKTSTVIVLYWIHLSFDGGAERHLIEAWMLALQDRDEEIPYPLAPEDYALESLGKSPTEPYLLNDQRLSMPGVAVWLARNFDFCGKEYRMVCVPAEYLGKLREKAMAELAEGTTETSYLSDSDILIAWATRLMISHLPKDSKKLVCIQQANEWRAVLKDLVPPDRPFLSNCVGTAATLMPAQDILQRPLGYVASKFRRAIIEQSSRSQVEAYAQIMRQDPRNKAPPFVGTTSMLFLSFTNCLKMNYFGFDISAAAVKPRDTPLLASYVSVLHGPYKFTNGVIIQGKDAKGNFWLAAYETKGLWDVIERNMAAESAAREHRSKL